MRSHLQLGTAFREVRLLARPNAGPVPSTLANAALRSHALGERTHIRCNATGFCAGWWHDAGAIYACIEVYEHKSAGLWLHLPALLIVEEQLACRFIGLISCSPCLLQQRQQHQRRQWHGRCRTAATAKAFGYCLPHHAAVTA